MSKKDEPRKSKMVLRMKNGSQISFDPSPPVRRTLWISHDLWDKMKSAAKDDGRSVSGWIRSLAVAVIEGNRVGRQP